MRAGAIVHHRHTATHPRRDEAGVVGGAEVLPFGLLIFVAGALLVANAWAVVDAKLATGAAAREAARTYVEAPSASSGERAAVHAAREVIEGSGRDPDELHLAVDVPRFARCERATVTVAYRVPAISLPFGVGFGSGVTVRSRHAELVDPLRGGVPAAGGGGGCGW